MRCPQGLDKTINIKGLKMAKYDETKATTRKAPPSTKEEDMLADAKSYAKVEFTSIKKLLEDLKVDINEADLAKAWIKVKYEQIVASRTNRVTYFD